MNWQELLDRWQQAGLLDAETAAKIHAFESAQPDTRRVRWPVILALIFGGLLLAAGLFLFVQAHWDELSPVARIGVTMSTLAALHIGAAVSWRFPALATTLHAIGTAGLGAAIAISGQVFNMDEHWPAAIFLWAVGAWVGYGALRDLPQLAMAAVLTPAWVISEVEFRHAIPDLSPWSAAFVAMLALTYLSANRRDETVPWRYALAAIGAVALVPAWILTAVISRGSFDAWLLLLPLPLAFALRGRDSWPMLAAGGMIVLQVLCATNRLSLAGFLVAGAASVALAGWGVAELRKERVNLGLAGFVITVVVFYFSYVADTINRSLGLIALGVLFLAGGWQLERLRRKLMRRIEGGAA